MCTSDETFRLMSSLTASERREIECSYDGTIPYEAVAGVIARRGAMVEPSPEYMAAVRDELVRANRLGFSEAKAEMRSAISAEARRLNEVQADGRKYWARRRDSHRQECRHLLSRIAERRAEIARINHALAAPHQMAAE